MFISFIGLLFTGYPIAFVLGGVAVAFIFVGYAADYFGYTLTLDHAGTKLYLGSAAGFVNRIYGGLLRKPELVALPMFIFMGLFLDRSGIAERMMTAMQQIFGQGSWRLGNLCGVHWDFTCCKHRHYRCIRRVAWAHWSASDAPPRVCTVACNWHCMFCGYPRHSYASKHHACDHGRSGISSCWRSIYGSSSSECHACGPVCCLLVLYRSHPTRICTAW